MFVAVRNTLQNPSFPCKVYEPYWQNVWTILATVWDILATVRECWRPYKICYSGTKKWYVVVRLRKQSTTVWNMSWYEICILVWKRHETCCKGYESWLVSMKNNAWGMKLVVLGIKIRIEIDFWGLKSGSTELAVQACNTYSRRDHGWIPGESASGP
jgi:hypothetical protein